MDASRIIEKADEYLRTDGNADRMGGFTYTGLYRAINAVADIADVPSDSLEFLAAHGAAIFAHKTYSIEYPPVEAKMVLAGLNEEI